MQTVCDPRGREQLLWGSNGGAGNGQKLGLQAEKWIEAKSAKGHTEYRVGEEPSKPAQKGDAISIVHLFVAVLLLVTIKETILGGSMPPPEI